MYSNKEENCLMLENEFTRELNCTEIRREIRETAETALCVAYVDV